MKGTLNYQDSVRSIIDHEVMSTLSQLKDRSVKALQAIDKALQDHESRLKEIEVYIKEHQPPKESQ
jgi:predicted component of type VI protein secretion system